MYVIWRFMSCHFSYFYTFTISNVVGIYYSTKYCRPTLSLRSILSISELMVKLINFKFR